MPSSEDVSTESRRAVRGDKFTPATTALASALIYMMSLGGAWCADVTFWVSEHFDQSPNVNIGEGIEPFAPQVLDLNALPWRRDGGDVRLCFDNRPMRTVAFTSAPPAEGTEDYCWHYSHWMDIGVERLDVPESSTTPITKGLLVSRNKDGTITCEAVFTQISLMWFLGYRDESTIRVKEMTIFPYGWDYGLFDSRGGIKDHLDEYDSLETLRGSGAREFVWKANLKRTWLCLIPAYRMYWTNVLDKCLSGVEALRHDKSRSDIYFPVLQNLRTEIFEKTEHCRIRAGEEEL